MTTGEIVWIVYLVGIVVFYLGMGIWNDKPDVRLGHLFLGPFNENSDSDKVGMLMMVFMWPLAIVLGLVYWAEHSKAWPIVKRIWKVVTFPWTVMVWVFNIRLWPLRKK